MRSLLIWSRWGALRSRVSRSPGVRGAASPVWVGRDGWALSAVQVCRETEWQALTGKPRGFGWMRMAEKIACESAGLRADLGDARSWGSLLRRPGRVSSTDSILRATAAAGRSADEMPARRIRSPSGIAGRGGGSSAYQSSLCWSVESRITITRGLLGKSRRVPANSSADDGGRGSLPEGIRGQD